MSLRARLAAWSTLLLLVVIVTVGFITARSVEDILVSQIDQDLRNVVERGPAPFPRVDPPLGGDTIQREPFLRPFAEIVAGEDSTILATTPSGFADEPDPLPDVPALAGLDGFGVVPSDDGSVLYRALVVHDDTGFRAVAAPLTGVSRATDRLIGTLLVVGGGVLVLGAAATWWTVRQGIRPVDEMVDTAEAIAGGDLSRRIPDLDPGTELGRLGLSLNEMLAHLEDALETERAAKLRVRRFAADASHELRTPVTTIAGYAQLHRSGALAAADDQDRAWARVESESRRMASLIEDLMTLARLGQVDPLRREEVDIARIVVDAVADHEAVDPARPVSVHGPGELWLTADGERMTQVISGLLSNVRTHTPEGTSIEIGVSATDDRVRVAVADDGPGIPDDAMDQVFDRFFRVDASRSRSSGGAGLGLSIVAAVVEAHGGTVRATRASATGGTRITIELPRNPAVSIQPDRASPMRTYRDGSQQ